jgi:hypothetical protein
MEFHVRVTITLTLIPLHHSLQHVTIYQYIFLIECYYTCVNEMPEKNQKLSHQVEKELI